MFFSIRKSFRIEAKEPAKIPQNGGVDYPGEQDGPKFTQDSEYTVHCSTNMIIVLPEERNPDQLSLPVTDNSQSLLPPTSKKIPLPADIEVVQKVLWIMILQLVIAAIVANIWYQARDLIYDRIKKVSQEVFYGLFFLFITPLILVCTTKSFSRSTLFNNIMVVMFGLALGALEGFICTASHEAVILRSLSLVPLASIIGIQFVALVGPHSFNSCIGLLGGITGMGVSLGILSASFESNERVSGILQWTGFVVTLGTCFMIYMLHTYRDTVKTENSQVSQVDCVGAAMHVYGLILTYTLLIVVVFACLILSCVCGDRDRQQDDNNCC